jgi:hypothetical protein
MRVCRPVALHSQLSERISVFDGRESAKPAPGETFACLTLRPEQGGTQEASGMPEREGPAHDTASLLTSCRSGQVADEARNRQAVVVTRYVQLDSIDASPREGPARTRTPLKANICRPPEQLSCRYKVGSGSSDAAAGHEARAIIGGGGSFDSPFC